MDRPAERLDRTTIAARLRRFPRQAADRPDLKQAAVAVCVTRHEGSRRW